jgi:hypothetical protein
MKRRGEKGGKGRGGERREGRDWKRVMYLSDTLLVSHGCPQSLKELPSLRNLMTEPNNRLTV